MSDNTQIHVAVSGVNGYIGSQVAFDLLNKGYTVHGTVLSNTPDCVAHLTQTETQGILQVFEANLLIPGSFDEAVEGCTYAIHIASPAILNVKDPQKDLVDPAVNGTVSFLESCKKAGVKKVVLTSSISTVVSSAYKTKVLTEEDWNTESSLQFFPYGYSKRLAEQAAWKFVGENAPEMKLVVIIPPLVLGPSLTKSLAASQSIIKRYVDGLFPGIIDLRLKIVDVRDVSKVHIAAMENDEAKGRYICCQPHPDILTVRELYEYCTEVGYKMSSLDLTGWLQTVLVKLSTYISPGGHTGAFLRMQLGISLMVDSSKATKELGVVFRDKKETIIDAIHDMIAKGHIKAPISSAGER